MNEGTDLTSIAPEDASKTQEELNASVDRELANMGYKVQTPEAPAEKTDDTPEEGKEGKDATNGTDTDGDGASEDGGTTAATPESPKNPPAAPAAEQPKPETPKPETTAEVQTLTLEIEDADGKKFTLKPGDNLDQVLAEFNPKSNGQIFQILNDFQKLEAKQETLNAEQQTKVQQEAEQRRAAEREQEVLTGWNNEVAGLQELGDLKVPKAQPGTPEWDKDPAAQRIDAVYNYMAKQNTERAAENKPPITSYTQAFYMMQKAEAEAKAKDEAAQENAEAKAKAALIGGASSPASGTPEVYVAGSAKSIWDVPVR